MSANGLLLVFGLVTSTLAARLLGPQGRGELAAVQNLVGLVSVLALIGLPDAVTYMTSKEQNASGELLVTAVLISGAVAVALVLLAIFFIPILLGSQRESILDIGRYYLLSVFIYSVAGLPYNSLQGSLKMNVWNMLKMVSPTLWLGTLVLSWLSSPSFPIPAEYVLRLHLIALMLYPLVVLPITKRFISGPYRFSTRAARQLTRYGLPSFLSVALQQLKLRLDQLLMAVFLPPRVLGLYAVSVAWSAIAPLIINAIGQVALPSIANVKASQDRKVVSKMMRGSVIVACILTTTWGFVTPLVFLRLMGEQFREALGILVLLIPAAGVTAMNSVASQILKGLGRPKDAMFVEMAGLAATFILLAVLLVPYQLVGASWASLISCLVSFAFALHRIARATSLSMSELLIPRLSDWASLKGLMFRVFRIRGSNY